MRACLTCAKTHGLQKETTSQRIFCNRDCQSLFYVSNHMLINLRVDKADEAGRPINSDKIVGLKTADGFLFRVDAVKARELKYIDDLLIKFPTEIDEYIALPDTVKSDALAVIIDKLNGNYDLGNKDTPKLEFVVEILEACNYLNYTLFLNECMRYLAKNYDFIIQTSNRHLDRIDLNILHGIFCLINFSILENIHMQILVYKAEKRKNADTPLIIHPKIETIVRQYLEFIFQYFDSKTRKGFTLRYDIAEEDKPKTEKSIAFVYAISKGYLDVAKMLVNEGGDPGFENYIALTFAVIHGFKAGVEYLLPLLPKDRTALSPILIGSLNTAANYGQTEILELLMTFPLTNEILGIREKHNSFGYRLLRLASINNHIQTVFALLRNEIILSEMDYNIINIFVNHRNTEAAKSLILQLPHIELLEILKTAVFNNCTELVKWIIDDRKFNLTHIDANNLLWTAITNSELVAFFLADKRATPSEEMLIEAAKSENLDIVNMFLNDGRVSPDGIPMRYRTKEIRQMLLEYYQSKDGKKQKI